MQLSTTNKCSYIFPIFCADLCIGVLYPSHPYLFAIGQQVLSRSCTPQSKIVVLNLGHAYPSDDLSVILMLLLLVCTFKEACTGKRSSVLPSQFILTD